MQNSSNIRITTYIVLLSVFVFLLQYLACRFIGASYITILLSIVLMAAGSVFLVYELQDYEGCFNFSFLCLLFQGIVTVIDYRNPYSTLPGTVFLTCLCIINWLIPALACFILYLTDSSSRYSQYPVFFRNSTIVFLLAYAAFLGYVLFFHNAAYNDYNPETAVFSFLPFATVAAKIEACIHGTGTLSAVFLYLARHILPFLPYGFLLALALKALPFAVRLLSLVVLPALTEAIQYFFRLGHSDIDDMIFAFLGAFLGMLVFFLLDLLCKKITGEAFLQKESRRNYYGSKIRF